MARVDTADGTAGDSAASTNAQDSQGSATPPPVTTTDDAPKAGDATATSTSDTVERPAMKDLAGVRFTEPSTDRRVITKADLERHGISPKHDDDLVWSADNGFLVATPVMNADTIDFLLTQPGFDAV